MMDLWTEQRAERNDARIDYPQTSLTGGWRRVQLASLLILGIAPFYFNGLYNPPLAARYRGWFWIVEVCTWIVAPSVVLLCGLRRKLFSLADLGLSGRVRGKKRPWALLALMVAVPWIFFQIDVSVAQWAYETWPRGWQGRPFDYTDVLPPPGPQTGWWRLLAVTYFCVTAGVVEEFYCRGALARLFGTGWFASVSYVIISSSLFAGGHWEGGVPRLAEALAVGLFAAIVFRSTQNLWPLILGHIVTDWYWFTGR